MIYLITNTASQDLYLTLKEGRAALPSAFTHYLIVLTREAHLNDVPETLAQVAVIDYENDRITKLEVTTVGLTVPGRYRYEVYGQNSANNINPNNVAVVGLVEKGWGVISDSTSYFTQPDMTSDTTIVYNG
jgi:hypothetical protein